MVSPTNLTVPKELLDMSNAIKKLFAIVFSTFVCGPQRIVYWSNIFTFLSYLFEGLGYLLFLQFFSDVYSKRAFAKVSIS